VSRTKALRKGDGLVHVWPLPLRSGDFILDVRNRLTPHETRSGSGHRRRSQDRSLVTSTRMIAKEFARPPPPSGGQSKRPRAGEAHVQRSAVDAMTCWASPNESR
jgi:hypothetical protein